MHLKGISNNIEYSGSHDLLVKWFEILDSVYFTHENCVIELTDEDRRVIEENPECKLKLKVVSFKKNITVLNFE